MQTRFNVSAGDLVIQWPMGMTLGDVELIEELIAYQLRPIRRMAAQYEIARSASGLKEELSWEPGPWDL